MQNSQPVEAITATSETWPELPLAAWRDTYATLHMLTQIIGKIRLAATPMLNHWWQVALYPTARGLTTSPMAVGSTVFEIRFDFVDHVLRIDKADGERREIALLPRPVAESYEAILDALRQLDVAVQIRTLPSEVAEPIPFEQDREHRAYDPEYANRCWRVMLQADRVLRRFGSTFIGKCSPIHVFWGAFDLAQTRFSGRRAPQHPGGVPNLPDWITREAYSHEVSSCGWWPGGGPVQEAAFYAYAYPEPADYRDAAVPAGAYYDDVMREFLLPYDAVRRSSDPDALLLAFFQATYDAAAELGGWDRAALERAPGEPRR